MSSAAETKSSEAGTFTENALPPRANQKNSMSMTVHWTGINASVPLIGAKKTNTKKEGAADRKVVLEQVSGIARPGEILAIMGGSGAGKTTLMNILAMQHAAAVQTTGDVRVNVESITQREMQNISAYVQQVDIFCGTLTVREHLDFSAKLRMARGTTAEQRKARVEEVIQQMNLTDCQNTMIGIPNRAKGISIGEKKRLAFAAEVLTDPAIMFCDEPTSGLDSFMAGQVVIALREMAKSGKTIITVIHQPSSPVFNMFDQVCFMSLGKPVYHGPVRDVCPFFENSSSSRTSKANFPDDSLHVPESYNPADHAIVKFSVITTSYDEDVARVTMIRKHFEASRWGEELRAECAEAVENRGTATSKEGMSGKYAASFLTQLTVLTGRAFKTTLRVPLLLKVRFAQTFITAAVIGLVYWQTEVSKQGSRNIEGILYNAVRDMNFLFLFPCINVITSELPVFFREFKAHVYSVEAYFISKGLAELPQYTILPLIYAVTVYWMTVAAWEFFVFACICVLVVYTANSVAYAGACVLGSEGLAITILPCYVLPMLVFGGFYINYDRIPVYFGWLSYLSWFRYGFEVFEINQWKDITEIKHCPKEDTPADCPAADGQGILRMRAMSSDNFILDIGILLLFVIVYRVIGLIALKIRARYQKT